MKKSGTLPLEVCASRQQNIDWATGKICRLLHLGCLGDLVSHPALLYRECGTQAPWLAPTADSAQPIRTLELAYRKLWKGEGESKFLLLLSLEYLLQTQNLAFSQIWSPPLWAVPVCGAGGCVFLWARGRNRRSKPLLHFCLETGLSWSQKCKRKQRQSQDGDCSLEACFALCCVLKYLCILGTQNAETV